MGVPEFDDNNFDSEVLKANGPVLVDFTAAWCGPCRQIAPVIEQLANENNGLAKVGKLDIDSSPETTKAFRVDSIPTLLIFKDGEVVQKFQGVQPKSRLQDALASVSA